MTDVIRTLKLPRHECSLSLAHNQNRDYYETVQQYADGFADRGCPLEWVSDEQKAKAVATNEIWVIQWYPDTPVGFIRLAACDLGVLLDAANEGEHRP
jgi:hypothetical protein